MSADSARLKPQPKRVVGKPFPKGNRANPNGRPVGLKNKLTVLAEVLMHEDAEAITRTVIDAAKGGDMVAARLVLERIAPPRKGRPVAFDLPKMETAADLISAIGALLEATARGDLTPDEAFVVAGIVDAKRRAIETTELEKRLAALEGRAIE